MNIDLRTTMKKQFPRGTKIVIALGPDHEEFIATVYNDKGECLASATGCSTPFSALEVLSSKVGRK